MMKEIFTKIPFAKTSRKMFNDTTLALCKLSDFTQEQQTMLMQCAQSLNVNLRDVFFVLTDEDDFGVTATTLHAYTRKELREILSKNRYKFAERCTREAFGYVGYRSFTEIFNVDAK